MPKFRKCDVLMRTSLGQRPCQEEINGRTEKTAKKSK